MAFRIPPDHKRCTATSKTTGERCKRPRYGRTSVCRKHGGAGAEASVKHGLHRLLKDQRTPLLSKQIEEVEKLWEDPKSMRHEITFIRAIYLKRIREIESANALLLTASPEEVVRHKIEELRRFVAIGQKLQEGKTITKAETEFIDSHRLRQELSAYDAKALSGILENSTRIVERMVRIEDGLQVNISLPELGGMIDQVKTAVRDAVEEFADEEVARAIKASLAKRFRKLAARQGGVA